MCGQNLVRNGAAVSRNERLLWRFGLAVLIANILLRELYGGLSATDAPPVCQRLPDEQNIIFRILRPDLTVAWVVVKAVVPPKPVSTDGTVCD